MKSRITLEAPAKINLFLDVLSRRPDGYHNIRSIMQTVSLCDTVTVSLSPAEATQISLRCSDPSLPSDKNNIAYRAAEKILSAVRGLYSVEIEIVKRIPVAAGLAGGSADAAAVLAGVNQLLGAPFSLSELCAIGASLGADLPFCLAGGTKITQGIGEVLTDCPPLPDVPILIAAAGEPVSTPAAYGALDKIYQNFTLYKPNQTGFAAMTKALEGGDIPAVCASLFNIFESALMPAHTKAGAIKQSMLKSGAIGALMSGSGPSVFALFDSNAKIQSAAINLSEQGIRAFICRPIRKI